jgi:hypothetical protein
MDNPSARMRPLLFVTMKTSTGSIFRLWPGVLHLSGKARVSQLSYRLYTSKRAGGRMLESTQNVLGVDKNQRPRGIFLYDGG